jgi:hypothetical protein
LNIGGKEEEEVDPEEAEKKAAEAAAANVPFSRLVALNKPEWPYGVVGTLSSAVVGGVQVRRSCDWVAVVRGVVSCLLGGCAFLGIAMVVGEAGLCQGMGV